MTLWYLFPFEILEYIFKQLPTIDLCKIYIITSVYPIDDLLVQLLYRLLINRPNLFESAYQLRNKKLLSIGNYTSITLYKAVEYSAERGDVDCINFLVSIGATWKDGLWKAAEYGRLDVIEYLISKDDKIGLNPNDWNNGMSYAAKGGHLHLIEYFVAKGANNWSMGISSAARGGHLYLVKYFEDKLILSRLSEDNDEDNDDDNDEWGTNPGDYDDYDKWTHYMEHAALGGHFEIVKYFIDKGINRKHYFYRGLACAAEKGHIDIVNYFIDKGCDDWNEIMCSIMFTHPELVEYFVQKGANDWNKGILCAIRCRNLNLIEYFLAKGANDWDKGLSEAIRYGDLDLIKFFESKGGKLNISSMCFKGVKLEIIEYLVDKGITSSSNWEDEMISAVECDNLEHVEYFIQKGATDFNKGMFYAIGKYNQKLIDYFIDKGVNDWTRCLWRAISVGNIRLTKYFVQKGGNINEVLEGQLEWSRTCKRYHMIDYLLTFT